MRILKPILFSTITIIIGLVILWLALPDASQTATETSYVEETDIVRETATETYSVEETVIAEETPIIEERFTDEEAAIIKKIAEEKPLVPEEWFTDEQKLTLRKKFSQIEILPSELTTIDLKLLGYHAILKIPYFLDVLTEDDVSAIIDELKQLQPKDLAKLIHHHKEMLTYANNVEIEKIFFNIEYGNVFLKHYHIRYYLNDVVGFYKFDFSPTIDEVLLRAVTKHPTINIGYYSGYTINPLFMHLANTSNNNIIPLIQFFLDEGADINAKNPTWSKTIFSYVGTLEIAQLLLANGADPNIISNGGEYPLIHAIKWGRSNELIKFLIDLGMDLHVKSSYKGVGIPRTPLKMAKDQVRTLKGIYIGTSNSDALYYASIKATFPARIAKAEEVVRIIEQALEAEASK